MDARRMLIGNSKELERFVETKHYKMSRELMKLRYKLSMTEDEIAGKIGITEEEYIGLECGNEEVQIEYYEGIIEEVRMLK